MPNRVRHALSEMPFLGGIGILVGGGVLRKAGADGRVRFFPGVVIGVVLVLLCGCLSSGSVPPGAGTAEEEASEAATAAIEAQALFQEAMDLHAGKAYKRAEAVLTLLLDKHPNSPEAERAKQLLEEVRAAIAEEEAARKKRVEELTKKMRVKYDEVREITWYMDKTTPYYDNTNNVHLYIGHKKYSDPWLRLRIRYAGEDWLFIERYTFKADGATYTIEADYFDVKRDNSGGQVWEWYDCPVEEKELGLVRAIIASEKTILRYEGDTYHKDRIITSTEKKALENVLNLYEAMGGNFDF